jgi:hypothetical protein
MYKSQASVLKKKKQIRNNCSNVSRGNEEVKGKGIVVVTHLQNSFACLLHFL